MNTRFTTLFAVLAILVATLAFLPASRAYAQEPAETKEQSGIAQQAPFEVVVTSTNDYYGAPREGEVVTLTIDYTDLPASAYPQGFIWSWEDMSDQRYSDTVTRTFGVEDVGKIIHFTVTTVLTDGNPAQYRSGVYVVNQPITPTIVAQHHRDTFGAWEKINFNYRVEPYAAGIMDTRWDLGDGCQHAQTVHGWGCYVGYPMFGSAREYRYGVPGTYTVSLNLSTIGGGAKAEKVITILPPTVTNEIDIDFTPREHYSNPAAGEFITLTADFTGTHAPLGKYVWSASVESDHARQDYNRFYYQVPATMVGQVVTFTIQAYDIAGNLIAVRERPYQITSNSSGKTFTASDYEVTVGEPVTFTLSVPIPNGHWLRRWDFGDGTIKSYPEDLSFTESHTYEETGTYTITVGVQTPESGYSRSVIVNVLPAPQKEFRIFLPLMQVSND